MFNPRGTGRSTLGAMVDILIQGLLARWQRENPALLKDGLDKVRGKTVDQLRSMADAMAGEDGIDLVKLAGSMGFKL